MGNAGSSNIIEVNDLKTHFYTVEGIVKAVDGVSFRVKSGKILGIVGESGCGKSATALSILQLIPPPGRLVEGKINYTNKRGEEINITSYSPNSREMRNIRGNEIAMVFQDPMTAFSPVYTIGNQVSESLVEHQNLEKKEALERTTDLLE